jgi:hypothetical protein
MIFIIFMGERRARRVSLGDAIERHSILGRLFGVIGSVVSIGMMRIIREFAPARKCPLVTVTQTAGFADETR